MNNYKVLILAGKTKYSKVDSTPKLTYRQVVSTQHSCDIFHKTCIKERKLLLEMQAKVLFFFKVLAVDMPFKIFEVY